MRNTLNVMWLGMGAVLAGCGGGARGFDEISGEPAEPLAVNRVNGKDDICVPGKQRTQTYCVSSKFNTTAISGGAYQADVDRGIRSSFDAWEAWADVRFVHLTFLGADRQDVDRQPWPRGRGVTIASILWALVGPIC